MRRYASGLWRPVVLAGFLAALSSAALGQASTLTLNIDNGHFNPVVAGAPADYMVRIDNSGNFSSAPTTIAFTVPENTVYDGVTDLAGCEPDPPLEGPDTVTCDVPALAPAATLSGRVNFRHMAAGTAELTGKIAGGTSFTRRSTVLKGADLELALLASPNPVRAGNMLAFSATVTNLGPYPSSGGTVVLTLPTGVSSDIVLPAGCDIAGDQISCTLGELDVDGTATFGFSTQVVTGEQNSTITMAATVSGASPADPVGTNDTRTVDVPVNPGTDVSLTKLRQPGGLLLVGDTVTFTLQPRYAGMLPTAARIEDTLPDNYAVVSATGGGDWACEVVDQLVACDYTAGTAAGFTAPITIVATAASPTTLEGVTNTAVIASTPENDEAGENNSADDGVAHIQEPFVDLTAHKLGPPRNLMAEGKSYQFQLWATNSANAGYAGPLTITDNVPEGLTVTGIAAEGWSCPVATPASPIVGPTEIVCTTNAYTAESPLGINAETPVIVLTAEANGEAVLFTNTMTVSFPGWDDMPDPGDRNPDDNTASTEQITTADTSNWANLRVAKSIVPPIPDDGVFAGDEVTFRIEIINDGPATAEQIVLRDVLAGIVAENGGAPTSVPVTSSPGLVCETPAGSGYSRTLICNMDALAPCEDDCPSVLVTVRPGDEGIKTNTANAYSFRTPDPNDGDNEASVSYEVRARTDVTVTKASPFETAGATVGQELTYVITASVPANGLSGADAVTVTDTLPAGVRFIEALPQGGGSCITTLARGDIVPATAPGNQLVCDLGRIENPGQQTVTVVVEPTLPLVGTHIVNTAVVSTLTAETDPDNNLDPVTVLILPPALDLVVSKVDSTDPVEIGSPTTYEVTLENIGPSAATNVIVTDILPASGLSDAELVQAPAGWLCEFADTQPGEPGGTLTCSIGYLGAGEKAVFEVEMTARTRGRHTNRAIATSDESEAGFETIDDNNEVGEDTTVRVRSDVGVDKRTVAADEPHAPLADDAKIDLREEFAWQMVVTSHADEGLDVAEGVTLTDTLPPGVELTKPPVLVGGPPDACRVTDSRIDCDLGDMATGTSVTIMVWAKVVEAVAAGQQVTNTARVSTLSFDYNELNDTSSASIADVRASTVAGSVWWDFDDNGARAGHDTGVEGVVVYLSGTALRDGVEINREVETLADGTFRFEDLPPGTYTLTYDAASQPRIETGRAIPGPGTGATAPDTVTIASIVVGGDEASAGHDFTLVPVALLSIDKVAAAPVFNNDGSYSIAYTLTVANGSREPLNAIAIADGLGAAGGNFGTYTDDAAPGFGTYTVASAPTVTAGTLTGVQAGYTGEPGADLIVSGGTLGAGLSSTVTYTLRVNPPMPRPVPLSHANTAAIDGVGAWSGQDSEANEDLADADSATATPAFAPAVKLEKVASFTPPESGVAPGQIISYTFTVTNTGNTPLDNVVVTDPPLPALVGLDPTPVPRLLPGESATRTATYALTQADIDNRRVDNTASVTGQWGIEGATPRTVTDEDSAAVTTLAEPALEIVKEIVANTITDPTELDQTITYSFAVTNTGNTRLRDVVVVDPRLGSNSPLAIGTLDLDETKTVTATYAVTQQDIDNGEVLNSAFAQGTYGPPDNADEIDSPPDDEQIDLYQDPRLTLSKVATTVPAAPRAGDSVTWTVTATNTGNVTLHKLVLSDDVSPLVQITPASHAEVGPGNSVSFTVTAPLTQDHINAGAVQNQAIVDFETPDEEEQPPVPSDDPGTDDPDDPTVTPLNRLAGISLAKAMITSMPALVVEGTALKYSFTITNTGNVPLAALELVEGLSPFVLDDPTALAGVTLQPQNKAGTQTGTQIVVEGSYALTQDEIDDGFVTNEATATGTPTHGPADPVSDDDEVTTSLKRTPAIALTKSVVGRSGDTLPVPGDIVTYAFAVSNTGNVALTGVSIAESLEGVTLSGGPIAVLEPGAIDTDTFTATYPLTQADIDRGYVGNSAEASGVGPGPDGPETVTDDSQVRHDLETAAGITIVKSAEPALSEPPQPDDEIVYSFVVTNTGNVTLTDVEVADLLAGLDMPTATIAELLPGADEAVTLTGTYLLKQSDIQTGKVVNAASVTGTPPSGPPVEAPSNEVTVPLEQVPGIAIVKSETSDIQDPTQVGEEIAYSFVVKNTGNLELTGVTIADPLLGSIPAFVIGALAPGAERTVGPIAYPVTAGDIAAGEVRNQATASGIYEIGGVPQTRTDLSGPTFETDEPVVVELFPPAPSLVIEKTASFTGGGVYAEVGDVIAFEFLVTNTGNVDIDDVRPSELAFTFGGIAATAGLSAFDPLSVTLPRGESQTFTASYALTQDDLNHGAGITDGVSNTAEAVGSYDGDPVASPPDSATLTLLPQQPTDVDIVKSTARPSILRGETVPFTIVVSNGSPADAGMVTITDRIPAGFVFVAGTASVDGAAVTPHLAGNDIVFENVRLLGNGRVEITLVLRALPGTPPGRYINRAFGEDALANPIGEGRAVVEIRAEGVFDCSDVIGTVFHDRNGNGYQDEGEPGIPGVRLSTARGVLVTTDEFGRYSIPCAALPDADIGSNFVLKLDPRTLPTGMVPTTDNPALARLTAGKMVEINFGVALGRQIKLTLSDTVFTGEGRITAEFSEGIDRLVGLLHEQRARLFVTFETVEGARARERLGAVTALIRQRWRAAGQPYALEIETLVVER